jgi:retinol dehydrogenase-12
MSQDLQGKVFLVTGATEGIGKAAALNFAKRGAEIVLVGRNKEKSEKVLAELKSQSGNEKLSLLLGDMSSMLDIRKVAAQFKEKYDRLDVLVNNAGAVFSEKSLSPDGYEMTFALNHLGYFLLSRELLPLLEKTPGSRLISTSSGAHATGKIDASYIAKREGKGAGFAAYADSKLANVLFTRELARRAKGVAVNCFHPGFVSSGFAQNNPGFFSKVIKFGANLVGRTSEKGAETLVWLATAPEAAKIQGEYCFDCKPIKTAKRGTDDNAAKALWELSEKIVNN